MGDDLPSKGENTMANNTNKITQKDRFQALIELVQTYGIEISNGDVTETTEDMVAFLQGRIDSLVKKGSSKKPNLLAEDIHDAVLDILSQYDRLKVAEMLQIEPIASMRTDEDMPISSQRLTSIITAMVKAGEVEKIIDKKTSYFALKH